jgi:serine protease Do
LGLLLIPLNSDLRAKYNIGKEITNGLVVVAINEKSIAAERGVKVGDVIVEASQDAMSSVGDLTRSIEKVKMAGRRAILLRLESGRDPLRFVAVPVQ